ncbi:MAG: beta-N-acetylglucosaminidase domain-containing protein [Candidatus Binatia bacterium]
MEQVFAHRGVVEGYYGPPYRHADRLWWVEKLGAWGMNRYVYAPKDDPLHRAHWRTPYGDAAMAEFRELIERGAAAGVSVGFAISPGLSIEYGSAADVRALQHKFAALRALGARFFSLALDDVPSALLHASDQACFGTLAAAHVHLAHAVAGALGGDCTLWLVPTDYVGTEPTDYLEALGAELEQGIEVAWTGRTVISPTIRVDEAAARARTLRRKLLVWDNVPVADGPMRPMLHLGPYVGRAADLSLHVSGLLLNPMAHAHASAVAVRTAAEYMRAPDQYDAQRAWRTAVAEIGAGAPGAFELFAAAHRFSPLLPADRDGELEAAIDAVKHAVAGRAGAPAAVAELCAALSARVAAAELLRAQLDDRDLCQEIEPWLASHLAESERMAAAADLLEVLCSDANAMQRVIAFFRFEGMLTRIPPAAVASYGPRRVLYPQLRSLRDDAAGFGEEPSLFLNRCLADELVRWVEQLAFEQLR